MKAYLDILDNIMTNGHDLRMNRTGIPDIGLSAGAVFEHDMSTGFPLVTTKKMGLKNIATELEFFLRGITDKKWLQDRKCHIWDEWANPIKVEETYNIVTGHHPNLSDVERTQLRNSIMDMERDLGPIYGFQWRHFGGEYQWNQNRINANPMDNFNPKNPGIDQVKNAIDKLKNNPNDRRILVSAWNPVAIPQMALPDKAVMMPREEAVHNAPLHVRQVGERLLVVRVYPFRNGQVHPFKTDTVARAAYIALLHSKHIGHFPNLLCKGRRKRA